MNSPDILPRLRIEDPELAEAIEMVNPAGLIALIKRRSEAYKKQSQA